MQQKLQELIEEYDDLLNSFETIDHIAGKSKEGKTVINKSKNTLTSDYFSLQKLNISTRSTK
jgi:ABC-type Fe3+-citrate transport system substrate-binding protein